MPFLGDELQNRGARGNTKAAALCQARRRADEIIGPYAGGDGREVCGGLPFPVSPPICLAL